MADPNDIQWMQPLEAQRTVTGIALWEAGERGDLTPEAVRAIADRADELFQFLMEGKVLEKNGKMFEPITNPRSTPSPNQILTIGD